MPGKWPPERRAKLRATLARKRAMAINGGGIKHRDGETSAGDQLMALVNQTKETWDQFTSTVDQLKAYLDKMHTTR